MAFHKILSLLLFYDFGQILEDSDWMLCLVNQSEVSKIQKSSPKIQKKIWLDEIFEKHLTFFRSGSLLDIIRAKSKSDTSSKYGVLDEVTIATVLKEVLKGLEYLHNNGNFHLKIC